MGFSEPTEPVAQNPTIPPAFCVGSDDQGMAYNFLPAERDQLYLMPPSLRDWLPKDHLALFVATAGACVREESEKWKFAGEFFKAHAIQALAIETAEGAAEWLHRRIREDWGFPDPPTLTMHDRFTSKYRGKRYSFGYPACPNLDDQQGLFQLLRPEEAGVQLTEGMMMEPEASVSALVFHHPDCAYFTAAQAE